MNPVLQEDERVLSPMPNAHDELKDLAALAEIRLKQLRDILEHLPAEGWEVDARIALQDVITPLAVAAELLAEDHDCRHPCLIPL